MTALPPLTESRRPLTRERLSAFLANEYDREEEAWRQTLMASLAQLDVEGIAAFGRVVGREGRRLSVRPAHAAHKFKEGDRVMVGPSGAPVESYARVIGGLKGFSEIVEIDTSGVIHLTTSHRAAPGEAVLVGPSEPRLDYWINQKAILDSCSAWPLLELAAGAAPPRDHLASAAAFECFAAASKGVRCLQGPPGTGKTTLIARVALARASRGESILVVAFSHRALDAVADAVTRERAVVDASVRLVKISSRKIDEGGERYEIIADFTPSPGAIILATSHKAFMELKKADAEGGFDLAVVDEASQLSLAGLVALSRSGRETLLVGDPCQLGPVCDADGDPKVGNGFLTLYDAMPFSVLTETHRLNAPLAARIGAWFYDDRLEPVADHGAEGITPGIRMLVARPERGESIAEAEASLIRRQIEEIRRTHPVRAKKRHEDPDIIVSCLHRTQVSRIRGLLGPLGEDVRIDSVERNQGQTDSVNPDWPLLIV